MKRTRGFTLIELLIALAIFSVIILSLYSAFQTGIFSYSRIDSASNVYQTARVILNKMDSDLKNSFSYSSADSRFKGDNKQIDFFSVLNLFENGQSHPAVLEVKYQLNNNTLIRGYSSNLDALKDSLTLESDEVSSSIKEISFQYADATLNPDQPFEWQDAWPKEGSIDQKKKLPIAVKIKLSVIEKNPRQQSQGSVEFTKVISLPSAELVQGGAVSE